MGNIHYTFGFDKGCTYIFIMDSTCIDLSLFSIPYQGDLLGIY